MWQGGDQQFSVYYLFILNFSTLNCLQFKPKLLSLNRSFAYVTTHSLCFLLGLLALSLKWLVRLLGKGSKIREHGNVVRLMVGSTVAERFAMLADPRTVLHGAGDVVNPNSSSRVSALDVGFLGAQYFFTFVYSFLFPLLRSLASGPQAHVRPQEKKSARCCLFKSHSDSEFIARNSAFYKPKLALIGQLHIT